jgi:Flp pilus assembly protein TadD
MIDIYPLVMLNETITFLSGVDIILLAALFGIIVGIITIVSFFLGIVPYIKSKKDFSDLFIYRKAKDLQQSDFAIQQALHANAEIYKIRGSDEKIEASLKNHENVLVTGMPKSGKTRSIYQAIKAVCPDFFVIKVPPKEVEQVRLPYRKRNYLVFFDDLHKYMSVNFVFDLFLKRVKEKSKKLMVVSTCRSGDELLSVTEKSLQTLWTTVVNLDEYQLNETEGRALAEEAGVKWTPEQFLGTPGSVILDVEDMKSRYRNSRPYEKTILRACKLLNQANIFIYEKELIRGICTSLFETEINESSWIDSLTHLKENSLVITSSSATTIYVYDATLESVLDDYDPEYLFEALLTLLITLEDAENLFYLGNAFYRDKDYENGEKSYNACLRINPDTVEAHYNLGVLLKNAGRKEEAEAEYRDALRLKPDYADAHNNLGNLLDDAGRKEEAEAEYRDALRLKPDDAEAHNNLGVLLYGAGRKEEAEAEYRDALRLKPDDAEAHYNLGVLLKNAGRKEEAEAEYREALRLKPDDAEAHNNLGILLKNAGRKEEAEAEYREALRLKPDDAEAHNNLGVLLYGAGRKEEAEAEYREALRLKPDDAEAHNNLGLLLDDAGRKEEAEAEYREALRLKPDYADAHINLGVLLYGAGRKEEAEAEYRDALRLKPDYAEAHGNLGILYSETGKKEAAKKELEIAKSLFEAQGRTEDAKKAEALLHAH